MFRKLIALGALAALLGVVAAPAQASAHVRHYTPSRTATVHTASSSMSRTHKHHVAKLTKNKKKKHHHGKKHK